MQSMRGEMGHGKKWLEVTLGREAADRHDGLWKPFYRVWTQEMGSHQRARNRGGRSSEGLRKDHLG